MKILDGKAVANIETQSVAKKIQSLPFKPKLSVILIGNNPSSETYVKAKFKACHEVGIETELYRLEDSTSEESVIKLIYKLNNDPTIDAILVQLPLPKHWNNRKIMEAISAEKDVDGFHPINSGRLLQGDLTAVIPCTPKGILTLLNYYKIPLNGKHVVILGRSLIVGKPLANLLSLNHPELNSTTTLCHSKTQFLSHITQTADILIAAMGSPEFVKASMIKEGAVVIDVGIQKIEGKIIGDVDFQDVSNKTSFITPVPGGVGPMTISTLLKNVLHCFKIHRKI
jgi:methylenetetrahydrofolate dehydrogenase (NADP+)/methenyltetrahydrofolate cyclohydrolase